MEPCKGLTICYNATYKCSVKKIHGCTNNCLLSEIGCGVINATDGMRFVDSIGGK